MSNKVKVTVLGAGNMGTAMAHVLGGNGHKVSLWNHEKDLLPLEQIKKTGRNKKYLPEVKLSSNVSAEPNLKKALAGSEAVFLAVPGWVAPDIVFRAVPFLEKGAICVDLSKGTSRKETELVTDLIKKVLPSSSDKRLCSVSGPAVASQMALGGFTVMNIASQSHSAVIKIKEITENENLKLLETKDLLGVELCGVAKNVYAIAIGLADGLEMSTNTKAVLITLALREMSALIVKVKADLKTVYDFAGVGDLIGTAFCETSRNRRFGELLGKGFGKEEALRKVGQVVEGAETSVLLTKFIKKFRLKAPLAIAVQNCIFKKADPLQELMKVLREIS